MNSEKSTRIRKRHLTELNMGGIGRETVAGLELDLTTGTTVYYSSEDQAHPIEHMFDGCSGRGGTRWVAAQRDTTEQLVLEFNEPLDISRIEFEVEELQFERTQQVSAEYSVDGGATFHRSFVQEYTFSPDGATYQLESLAVKLRGVMQLRLTVVPNKGGSGAASVTSLRLYS